MHNFVMTFSTTVSRHRAHLVLTARLLLPGTIVLIREVDASMAGLLMTVNVMWYDTMTRSRVVSAKRALAVMSSSARSDSNACVQEACRCVL
jgi:hypothetical protein